MEPESSPRKRLDRHFAELLQELRVGQTAVQLLFGFLLTIPFAARFGTLPPVLRLALSATLLLATLALACLMAPVLIHRWCFRRQVRPLVVEAGHRLATVGLYFLMLAVLGAVAVVTWATTGGDYALLTVMLAVSAAALVGLWVVLPWQLRRASGRVRYAEDAPAEPDDDQQATGSRLAAVPTQRHG